MSKEKLFFFDLETTGVMHWRNGIHQIAFAIVIDGELMEEHDFKVKPHPKAVIDMEALQVGNVTIDQILAYPSMQEVYKQIIVILNKYIKKFDKTDKFHLVGYNNASFDNAFFRAFFVQNGDNYFGSYFWSDSLDCFILASRFFMKVRSTFKDFKQGTVAEACGIVVDQNKLHDAKYDLYILRKIWEIVS